MKYRSCFFILTPVLVVWGMLISCEQATNNQPAASYTVTFIANGGIPAPQAQVITQGGKISEPPLMNKTGYSFGGWYKEPAFSNKWNFVTDTVTGKIYLYAKWLENFNVTFAADGGIPAPQPQIIADSGKVTRPPAMEKDELYLEGWYKEPEFVNRWDFDNCTITGNITLFANWVNMILVSGANFNAKMRWLDTNAESNNDYVIEVDADQSVSPQTFSYAGKNNITVTLVG